MKKHAHDLDDLLAELEHKCDWKFTGRQVTLNLRSGLTQALAVTAVTVP